MKEEEKITPVICVIKVGNVELVFEMVAFTSFRGICSEIMKPYNSRNRAGALKKVLP